MMMNCYVSSHRRSRGGGGVLGTRGNTPLKNPRLTEQLNDICGHKTRFRTLCVQNAFAVRALPRTTLEDITALPQTP